MVNFGDFGQCIAAEGSIGQGEQLLGLLRANNRGGFFDTGV